MNKIFYWSPHLSNVATIKNVLNSAFSVSRFGGRKYEATILDAIGEWSKHKNEISQKKISYVKLNKLDLSKFFPLQGYFKSRFISCLVFFISFFSLRKILMEKKPKYLIIHLVTSLPLLLLSLCNFQTNFILRISGLPKLTFIRKFIWKMASKKLFVITCPSVETKNYLLKMNIFPANKIEVLLDPILNISEIVYKKKEQIQISGNGKYLLCIGRLTRQKNHAIAIQLFDIISKKIDDYFLYIIGEGENKENLSKKIKELNLENKVFLLGQKNNVFPYIRDADAILSTSLWEDPGAVMIEAAFCNTTIISSDCSSGPKEFIENNKGGYLFKNNDLDSLVNVFAQYKSDTNQNIFSKKITAKNKCRNFTIFSHYRCLSILLESFSANNFDNM